MKALVLTEYRRLTYQEFPKPQLGPREVLVAVKACGICGSDVHGMDGSTGRRRPPIIMGHEAAGVIEEVGLEVKGWEKGEPVTFDSTLYCGECAFCQKGQINLCDRRRVLGVSCEEYRQHGAFADLVSLPQHVLYRLPPGLAFEHAALAEPFAIALHAVKRVSVGLEDAAVVIGAGMIGLALVQALRQTGCGRIIVTDIADERLRVARELGAEYVINSANSDPLADIHKITGGAGATLSFEAVGITPTVDLALRCLQKGGKAVLVGNVAPKVEFPLQAAVTRELTVFGSCASRGEYPTCLDWMAAGRLKAEPLISAIAPLAEGAAWFDRLYSKEPGLLKVVLKPAG